MSKTFSHAGVSRINGEFKLRFSNTALYVKALAKAGNIDIDLVQLAYPMTKEDAAKYLLSINFDNGNAEVRAVLEAASETQVAEPAVKKERDGTSTLVGTSRLGDVFKLRFSNNPLYPKILAKEGYTDINFIQLPESMSKQAAAEYLKSINFGEGDAEVQAAIEAVLAPKAVVKKEKPAKAEVAVDAPAADDDSADAPFVDVDTVTAAELEDAPF